MSVLSSVRELLSKANQAKAISGKSLLAQLREIVQLRLGQGKLGISDYYQFALFDDRYWDAQSKKEVIGWRGEGYYGRKLNARPWNVLTGDKLVAHATFTGLEFPVPRLQAVFHPFGRTVAGAQVITEEQSLAEFLRKDVQYPFFSKPSHGALGRNSVAAVGYDETTDSLKLASGDSVPVSEYVAGCYPIKGVFPWEAGFLFQECLVPDPRIAQVIGNTVSSFRMICLYPDGAPELLRCIWKIPVGNNMTDNFNSGASGNLVADIDLDSGKVKRVLSGTGLNLTLASSHPDTEESLENFVIPDWPDYVDLCRRATAAFPGVRFQHWDIALTDRGPVILELNTFGGMISPQLASSRGMLTPEFLAQLNRLSDEYPVYRGGGDY